MFGHLLRDVAEEADICMDYLIFGTLISSARQKFLIFVAVPEPMVYCSYNPMLVC